LIFEIEDADRIDLQDNLMRREEPRAKGKSLAGAMMGIGSSCRKCGA
jgi:hypothetical protein